MSFPALMASGRPLGPIVSCNPAELRDERRCRRLLRLSHRRPRRLARLPRRVRALIGTARGLRRVLPRARGPTASTARVHARVPLAQSVDLPGRDRLRPRRPARAELAQPRGQRPDYGPPLDVAGAARIGGGPARLPELGLTRLRRCRAHAGPDRLTGGHVLSGHRLQGTPARGASPGRQHDR